MATKLEIILELQNRISGELKAVRGDLDRLSTSTKKANTNVKSFDRSMKTAGKAATGLRNILLPLVGITLFVGAIRKLAEFEQAMANVRSVIAPVVDEFGNIDKAANDIQFQALTDEARRLGAVTVFSASQAAGGLEFLARAGFSANEAISALEGTLNLAAAGGLGLAEAADIASNVLSGFNLPAAEAGRVADVLAATAASANTNVSQLGEAMKLVAPIAAAMGVPVETAAAAIGKLSDAGLQGSLAGTGLRRVLATLNTPSAKLTRTMGKLGLETKDVAVSGDNLAEVMGLLGERGLTATDALQLFGDRGAPAALAMANVSEELGVLNEQLLKAEGRAKEMAGVMSDTLQGAFKQLGSAIEETLLQTGDAGLLGGLRDLIDTLAGLVRVLNGTQDPLDKNAVAFQKAANAVKAFGTFIAILVGLKTAVFLTGLSGGLAVASTAFAGATAAGLTFTSVLGGLRVAAIALLGAINPLFIIAALGTAFYAFATNSAPATVGALANIRRETNALKKSLEGLDSQGIEVNIRTNAQDIIDTSTRLSEINEQLADLGTVGSLFSGDELRAERDTLEQTLDLLIAKKRIIRSTATQVSEAEALALKARIANLETLRGDANIAALAAVKADRVALEKINKLNLDFAKKTAKDVEAIETEALKRKLQKQEISIEEYYFRIGLLAEERQKADIDILDAKLIAIKANQQAEIDELRRVKDADVITADGGGGEQEAIERRFANNLAALKSGYSVELREIEIAKATLQSAIDAGDAKLETQELAALDKKNIALEVKRKADFDSRLQDIKDQQTREAEAAQRDVESGTINQFELAGKLAEIDESAIAKYKELRTEAQLFNSTVQDPANVVSIQNITDAIEESASRINPQLEKIKTNLTAGLAEAFESLADGSKNAKDAFEDFAKSFLRYILQMITQAIALQAIKLAFGAASGGSFSEGGSVGSASKGGYFKAATGGYIEGANTGKAGYVQGFAEGGFITGKGTKTSDSIPARLSTGEYVIKAAAVDHYGLNFIEAVNRLMLPSATGLPAFAITRPRRARFATGGSVDGASNTQSETKSEFKLRVINNVDPDLVEGFMNSREGEETVMNLISNNADKIKGILQ